MSTTPTPAGVPSTGPELTPAEAAVYDRVLAARGRAGRGERSNWAAYRRRLGRLQTGDLAPNPTLLTLRQAFAEERRRRAAPRPTGERPGDPGPAQTATTDG